MTMEQPFKVSYNGLEKYYQPASECNIPVSSDGDGGPGTLSRGEPTKRSLKVYQAIAAIRVAPARAIAVNILSQWGSDASLKPIAFEGPRFEIPYFRIVSASHNRHNGKPKTTPFFE